jgi:hypothetical protein
MIATRPLPPAPRSDGYALSHLGDQPMRHAPKVLLYGTIRRGHSFAFAPPGLDPKNTVTGVPKTNG